VPEPLCPRPFDCQPCQGRHAAKHLGSTPGNGCAQGDCSRCFEAPGGGKDTVAGCIGPGWPGESDDWQRIGRNPALPGLIASSWRCPEGQDHQGTRSGSGPGQTAPQPTNGPAPATCPRPPKVLHARREVGTLHAGRTCGTVVLLQAAGCEVPPIRCRPGLDASVGVAPVEHLGLRCYGPASSRRRLRNSAVVSSCPAVAFAGGRR
jgi:hypothetical protein